MTSFENKIYQQLIERYPDFHSIRSYLESDEGGLFRVVDMDIDNDLCIIRYEKGVSNMDLPHSKWFRSVAWNTRMNRPVCVAPPKSSSEPFPYATCTEAIQHGMRCEEQLDGVMINCFRVAGNDKLYISTRSSLYAAGHFYSSKSFRTLFMEAYLAEINMENQDKKELEELMQKNTTMIKPDPLKDEYAIYYSFLLQHKEHRIVKKINDNCVTLLQMGTVYQDGHIIMNDNPYHYPIGFPIPETKQSMNEWFLQLCNQQPYDFQGIVLKDVVGNRWRFRTEKYKMVKSLRGNQAGDMERYAQLFVQNLQYTYLDYYPEDAMSFALQSACMTTIIETIYRIYLEMHVIKSKPIQELLNATDKMYHPHLYALHGIYLSQLRPHHKKITIDVVRNYFHKQPWQRIAFLLRKTQHMYLSLIHSVMEIPSS